MPEASAKLDDLKGYEADTNRQHEHISERGEHRDKSRDENCKANAEDSDPHGSPHDFTFDHQGRAEVIFGVNTSFGEGCDPPIKVLFATIFVKGSVGKEKVNLQPWIADDEIRLEILGHAISTERHRESRLTSIKD